MAGIMDITQVELAMDEVWRIHPAKAQFHRMGSTIRWFRPRGQMFKGKRFHFKAYTKRPTGVRGNTYAAASAYNYEYPEASTAEYTELSYDRGDMTIFTFSLNLNEFAADMTDDSKHAVFKLASKMISEVQMDMNEKVGLAVHQNNQGLMATVAAKYASTGASYSEATTAFLQITSAQVAKFTKGQVLDIGTAGEIAGGTGVQVTVYDVIYTDDGPWPLAAGNAPVADIGPGIVVYNASSCTDITAADEIYLSGEGEAGEGFNGFPSWFSGSTNVYFTKDDQAVDRDAPGNGWSIPTIVTISAAGSETILDLDEHVGQLADVLPQVVNVGRRARMANMAFDVENDISLPTAMVLVTTPKLANSAVRDAADTARFTKTMLMSDESKRELFGTVGFDGIVYRSATLPPIAIQADLAAERYKMRLIDPQSFSIIKLDDASNGVQLGINWLLTNGNRWHRVHGTNGRLTNEQVAAGNAAALLMCDQPQANAEIRGVKSHRT